MPPSTTKRRSFLRITGATGVTGLGTLAGCSGRENEMKTATPSQQQPSGGTTTSQQSTQTPSFTTKLAASHHPISACTLPVQVATAKGMFEKRNVSIDSITSFSGGGTTVRGIVTGGIGAGNTALPALVKGYLAGAPIHLAGLTCASTEIDFHVLPDSPIESIQDVKGKKIAISNPGSSSEASLIGSVKEADGISLDDVEILYAGGFGESITALQEGKADVSWNFLPVSIQMLDAGKTRRVWKARDYAPYIVEFVIAMGNRVLQEQPKLARGIVEAYIEAYEFIKSNPDETARIWSSNHDMPEKTARSAVSDVKPKEMFNIELTKKKLKGTGSVMIEQDLIDSQPPWKKIAKQGILPESKRVDWL